jgi:hypothetical protein
VHRSAISSATTETVPQIVEIVLTDRLLKE